MTSQICKKVPKHQMGNVIAPNTSGKQKKLPRQRFKEVNPATIKYPENRATIMKHQSGNKVKPYITKDPNDPRIQAYNDSLTLYNNHNDVVESLLSKKYAPHGARHEASVDQFNKHKLINEGYGNYITIGNLKSTKDFLPGKKDSKGKYLFQNEDIKSQLYSDNIEPRGATYYSATARSGAEYKYPFESTEHYRYRTGDYTLGDMRVVARYDNVNPKQEVILESKPPTSLRKTVIRSSDKISKIPSRSINLTSVPNSNELAVSKDTSKYNTLRMKSLWANIAKQDNNAIVGTLKPTDTAFKEGFTIEEARQFPQDVKDKYGLNYIDSNIIKRQSGGVVDPKLMEYLRSKGYPQGPETQPTIEQGKDNVKPTREQARSMKIKKALSTAGTGLQDLGTNMLTMGTQLRKPTEDEIKRGRGTWGDRAPVIAGAVTAGVANELTAGGMGYLAGKIAQRGASKMLPSMVTEEAPRIIKAPKIVPEPAPGPRLQFKKPEVVNHPWIQEKKVSPIEVFKLDLNRSSVKDTPWSMDIGFEASAGVKKLPSWQKAGWVPNDPPAGKISTGLITKMQRGDSKSVSFLNYKPFITENSYAGEQPLVTQENLQGVLEKLKGNAEGSFIKRSHITPEHAFLEKLRGEYEREIPYVTSELHKTHRAITPVHQSMVFHVGNPYNDDLISSNLQVQKTAPGRYLYENNYDNLTNDAIEEAMDALNEGRKRGLRFDFRGNNNTLYDPKTNKFSFIDMGLYPKSYNMNNPLQEFNKHLVRGIDYVTPTGAKDLIRRKSLSALSYKEGGDIENK